MKKYLTVLALALAALVSCGKETLYVEEEKTELPPIAFDLTAKHPDGTKLVKTGWERGDVIYVFFNTAAAPKFLKMRFDGSSWSSTEMDGETVKPGCLGLRNGDKGSMRAVFLPFGSYLSVSANGTAFEFSETLYSYYLTARLDYTVSDNKVSGAFNMQIPEGYVQFFVDNEGPSSGYVLSTDAVVPVGLAYVTADGTVVETSDKTAGDEMPGYVYRVGWLFSGKLSGSYSYSGKYYFALTGVLRKDYFVSGKTLSSHSAVKLPSEYDSRWQLVGNTFAATLKKSDGTSLGVWHTTNYNQPTPESAGNLYDFDGANSVAGGRLPSKEDYEKLVENCTWSRVSVKGQAGFVVQAAQGFIFLPTQTISGMYSNYWTSTREGSDKAWYLEYPSAPYHVYYTSLDREFSVRLLAE